MQRSFSVVMDDDDVDETFEDEQILRKYGSALSDRKNVLHDDNFNKTQASMDELTYSTSEPLSKKLPAAPSGRQTVLKSKPPNKNRMPSDSEQEDSDIDEEKNKNLVKIDEYDPKKYEKLEVSGEIKELFQYITKYIPQNMNLDNKFKPFVPEFLPAVGDIDAFLKVIPPSTAVNGENFQINQELGLVVLDEPAANQSDSALLHLQLRAESVNTTHDSDIVVKKLDNIEKNSKIVDKWIKDISALHKSKSYPVVRYTESMPDLDELMQEWPEEMETHLKENGFPEPEGTVEDYINIVCGVFQIPTKNKIHALHLLFSLYAAVKSSQLFKNTQLEKSVTSEEIVENVPDQLVLD